MSRGIIALPFSNPAWERSGKAFQQVTSYQLKSVRVLLLMLYLLRMCSNQYHDTTTNTKTVREKTE